MLLTVEQRGQVNLYPGRDFRDATRMLTLHDLHRTVISKRIGASGSRPGCWGVIVLALAPKGICQRKLDEQSIIVVRCDISKMNFEACFRASVNFWHFDALFRFGSRMFTLSLSNSRRTNFFRSLSL